MISRLTACAAVFSLIATAAVAFAAQAQQHPVAAVAVAAKVVRVVELPRVVVIGHRVERSVEH